MTRIAIFALLFPASAFALDGEVGTEACAATTAVVADAVELRAKGQAQADVVTVLKGSDLDPQYVATIDPLVAWVYDLPQDQLNDQAVSAYNEACLMQLK